MNQIASKRVFITGASSGIGAALARQYAMHGASIGLVARNQVALENLVATLPNPERHKIYPLDVTNHAALTDAAQDFINSGGADIVIASAGISLGTMIEYDEDFPVFEQITSVNLVAAIKTFAPFISTLKERAKSGHNTRLVGIASVAGIRGLPAKGAYCASKAAIIAYCESLRIELKTSGIKVVTLIPGYIDTPMTKINTYKMPFLMPVEKFAETAFVAIEKGKSYIVIPWQMGIVAKLLRIIPNWAFDRIFAKAPRKKRINEDTHL